MTTWFNEKEEVSTDFPAPGEECEKRLRDGTWVKIRVIGQNLNNKCCYQLCYSLDKQILTSDDTAAFRPIIFNKKRLTLSQAVD